MKRVLSFENTDAHRTIYASLYGALRFGRNMIQQAPGKQVLRQERDIFRVLQSIGVVDPAEKDAKVRTLAEGGGSVVISQADLELLQTRIDEGPWTGDAACDMADALDFLGAAPEHMVDGADAGRL